MTFIYTPPEPFGYVSHIAHVFLNAEGGFVRCEGQQSKIFNTGIFTDTQLRSEVERVRRETVEACAKLCHSQAATRSNPDYVNAAIDCSVKIRRLLK